MIKLHAYLISGLSVASEIELSGVTSSPTIASKPQVCIFKGKVPESLPGASATGVNWALTKDTFLLQVPRIARFYVSQGSEIIVEPRPSVDDAAIVPFLLSTALGALLHQRGECVLHASVVSHENKAVALCGNTGIGKSTLCAALCFAGYRFIADDMALIRFDKQHNPSVLADSRQHRLWQDAIHLLGLNERKGEPVRDRIEKYHIAPVSGIVTDSITLKTIILLKRAEVRDQLPEIKRLRVADAAALLRNEVFRPNLASKMGRDAELFQQIAQLLKHVDVFMLTRPQEINQLGAVVNLAQQTIEALG
ncbi:MAG: hypothetical protein Q7T96_19305 [Methylobacter sp.]|nr:hypothetical protein [Methylobacter sp.]